MNADWDTGYSSIWPGACEQESTNHNTFFLEWKPRFITIILIISIYHDYSYLLDQGPINSIHLDDKLCLRSFQQSKEVSLKDCAYYYNCANYVLCISRDTQHSYGWHLLYINARIFLAVRDTMWSTLGIQKEDLGNHAFFKLD